MSNAIDTLPNPLVTLRFKYATNWNGFHGLQFATLWNPEYKNRISNLRFLFKDRLNDQDQKTAYIVDPSTAATPISTTEMYNGEEYRYAPIDMTIFDNISNITRVVYGVSDEAMYNPLNSIPSTSGNHNNRTMALRIANRDINTVQLDSNGCLGLVAWDDSNSNETKYIRFIKNSNSPNNAEWYTD